MANNDYKASPMRAAQFTPLAELAQSIDYLDHEIPLGRTNFANVTALKIGMACLVDDEFMQLVAITSTGVTVKRGTADTVPARHVIGSLIWFFDNTLVGTDGKEHSAGEDSSVKYSPYTIGGGGFPIARSNIDTVHYNWRFFRPYPPGQMRAHGQRWYTDGLQLAANDAVLELTWAHRDRTIEADQLVDHDVTNIGPEPGTTYTARIYDGANTLRATYANIMERTRDQYGNLIPPSWGYHWQQAMVDFGYTHPLTDDAKIDGYIVFCSTREGFDSWQAYRINFVLDTQGYFIKAAQLAQMQAQVPDFGYDDPNAPPIGPMIYDGQVAQIVAKTPADDEVDGAIGGDGMFVTQIAQPSGSETNFYTPMNRNLFEAPYGFLVGRDGSGDAHKLVTVVARPSDRLTDAHDINTRFNWPIGSGASQPFLEVAEPQFTPWATLVTTISYMDTAIGYDKTSFVDGVSLSSVAVGQIILVDAEFCRIDAVGPSGITIARGCYDTVPAKHGKGARVWFVDAHHGNDPTAYPERMSGGVLGGLVEVKMRPATTPPLDLKDIPIDTLKMQRRVQRPYPPGQVYVNGKRWFNGAILSASKPAVITWVDRNRLTQAGTIIDHDAVGFAPEGGQKYRLSIDIWYTPRGSRTSQQVNIRKEIVDGTTFTYTWDMAKLDGYRAGSLLQACGRVTVGMTLYAIRDDLDSWQGYVIPLLLPSYTCPPGQSPGGGQLPPTTGGGNGDIGENTPGGQTPGDNTGDGPKDPIDNGSGDNGNGPPAPPEVPPDWPDPITPTEPDPNDPNPALAAHWDLNWDRHWDAYTKDNTGN